MSAQGTDRAALARAVAAAVAAVPGVARLSGGAGPVEVATLYPGGKVLGVRVAGGRIAVHVAAARLPLPPLVAEVRAAAERAAAGLGERRPVDVTVEALELDALPPRPGGPGG